MLATMARTLLALGAIPLAIYIGARISSTVLARVAVQSFEHRQGHDTHRAEKRDYSERATPAVIGRYWEYGSG